MRRFGEFILNNRIILIIAIVAITVLFSIHLPELRLEDDETTWFSKNDPTLKAYSDFEETFAGAEFVIVAYESDNSLVESEIAYLSDLTKKLEKAPHVNKVTSLTAVNDIIGTEWGLEIKPLIEEYPNSDKEFEILKQRIEFNPFFNGNLISKDRKVLGVVLEITEVEDDKVSSEISERIVTGVRRILSKEHKETDRKFYLGGSTITDAEVSMMMETDMRKFFPLSMLLTALVLLVIFRNLLSVFLPLLSVFLSLVWTLGLKGMVGSPITPISTTLFALITVIGIADSIHLISHYRIELPRLEDKKKALLETYQRAGKPCLFTSLTTSIGFSSLGISHIPGIRNLGIFASFGIMSAFVLSMIIVPVGLQLIRKDIKGLRLNSNLCLIPNPKDMEPERQDFMGKILEWIGEFNLKHPKLIIILTFLIVLIMGAGIMKIHVEGSMLEYFKRDAPLRKDAEFLDDKLNGISSTEIIINGKSDSFKEPAILKKIKTLQNTVESHPKVSISYSIVDYLKLINRALNGNKEEYFKIPETREAVAQCLLLYEMSGGKEIEDYTTINYDTARISVRTKQMNEQERKKLIREIERYSNESFSGFKVEITGFDNLVHEITERIVLTQIQSLGLAMLIILGLMMLLFGIRGGLVSILPNIFPIIFVLGLMGYAHFYLNIATAIIASIAIGIVVDDTIHYFSHFRHEYKLTGERKKAMITSLRKVGSALCFTTLILVLGSIVFLFSETSILIDYGILSGIAITTALLGDLFIGPVLLTKFRTFKKKAKKQSGQRANQLKIED